MIPAITPPTDNLYKLISLVGLGILVLGIVNSSTQSKAILETKIEIEYIEKQIVDTIHHYSKEREDVEVHFINTSEAKSISELIAELREDGLMIHNATLPKKVTSYVDTELDVIKIKLLAIKKQEFLNNILFSFSILLMILGFTLWYLKEQRWHDKKTKTNANNVHSK
jgi:hypothetical protein